MGGSSRRGLFLARGGEDEADVAVATVASAAFSAGASRFRLVPGPDGRTIGRVRDGGSS